LAAISSSLVPYLHGANNFLRFKICFQINNVMNKNGTLPLNMEANHGCMQMITVKSKRYPWGKKISRGYMRLLRKKISRGYMRLLPTSLVCLKIYRNLFILGVIQGIWVRPNKMPHGFTRRFIIGTWRVSVPSWPRFRILPSCADFQHFSILGSISFSLF